MARLIFFVFFFCFYKEIPFFVGVGGGGIAYLYIFIKAVIDCNIQSKFVTLTEVGLNFFFVGWEAGGSENYNPPLKLRKTLVRMTNFSIQKYGSITY